MSTTTQATKLATQFEAINDEISSAAADCNEEEWQYISIGEGWTIAAVVHHVAIVQQAFAGIVARLAAGETYSPDVSWDEINESNARHAEEYAAADKHESLEILQASRDAILQSISGLDDKQLERTAGTFGDREMTVAQVIEWVVVGHPREHMESIRATLAG